VAITGDSIRNAGSNRWQLPVGYFARHRQLPFEMWIMSAVVAAGTRLAAGPGRTTLRIMTQTRIAIIGDYQPGNPTHTAIADALAHAGCRTPPVWVPTQDAAGRDLAEFAGFWIAPGSPYRSLEGALEVIRYAREHDRPLLGTCGGFQHVVLEYARNVLGLADAAHAEYDPYASNLFVTPLSCSLAGRTMSVTLGTGSFASALYGGASTMEQYYCDFGLNPDHIPKLTAAGLVVSGVDSDGEVRIVELPELRFFLATLFVPHTSSTPAKPHPLVSGFVRAAS
jgi:CTP synthase (UTP-ammonia lyase)